MNKNNLNGKIVWITGGKRIGQAVGEELARLGANLVISYRSSKDEAEALSKKAKKYGSRTLVVQCDTTSQESVMKAVSQIKKEFKRLDVLVLMASIFDTMKFENISAGDFLKNFDVHVLGTFFPVQLSLSLMKPGSHIITISDRTSIGRIYSGYLPYVVTKGAVAIMTKALAAELGPKGIIVNSIAPGPILKPDDLTDKEWKSIRASSIIKYPITDKEAVREFVDTVVRLCFVRSTGSVYPLDLGQE